MRITESDSKYQHLEQMSTFELLSNINNEDKTIANSIEKVIPEIQLLVDIVFDKLKNGGRLFYIGAGTSGRLGIVDASEIPPTFGIEQNIIIGIIAGGDSAIRKAVEFAEDDVHQAYKDLEKHDINENDFVIGIAASGSTPYVIGGLKDCALNKIATGCITCNPNSPLYTVADFPIAVVVGPEFLTGSTRMKAGTAQKLVLNMISTSVMIKLGKVKGNKMVDMQLSNEKLIDRGVRMIQENIEIEYESAKKLLLESGSVRKAISNYNQNKIH